MKKPSLISPIRSTPRRKLCLAIAAQMMLSAGVKAAPTGGTVVGGDGIIDQAGLDTTITQNSDRLAIDWASFNIGADERVQFIQPDASSVALNRILGNDASQIFGRLDANGHVILMNPNGVLFGENSSINVGGLVASGLAINAADFMNGEFALRAVEGADGTVINRGIINAATGGSVALIGTQVDNQGLISAKLGSVNLAAGKEAVLTFDNQGLLGVRVTQEVLQNELGVDAAVSNSGEINAEGGRILLTGSVSQDIFSQAVNSEGLNGRTSVVMHDDGSFTLGAGADVVNTGTLSTSSDSGAAGQIVVLGDNVNSSGAILADTKSPNSAGNIELHARNTTLLTQNSKTSATNNGTGTGGDIKVLGDRVGVLDQSNIDASGTNGGGHINIGGGFQGKEPQLRNASRTVVGKDALIEANAITKGDGGDVIVWADQTTSFTGEINVRGGVEGGDGGFVEVSGKENLRFLGNVDRTAVRGKNGTLLLDPETITIITAFQNGPAADDSELDDRRIVMNDSAVGNFVISDAAISAALAGGDLILQATRRVETQLSFPLGFPEVQIVVADKGSTSSLIIESGGAISLDSIQIDLGAGNLSLVAGLAGVCLECVGTSDVLLNRTFVATSGSIYMAAPDRAEFIGYIGRDLSFEQVQSLKDLNVYGGLVYVNLYTDTTILGDINLSTNLEQALIPFEWPSGRNEGLPAVNQSGLDSSAVILGNPDYSSALNIYGDLKVSSKNFGAPTNEHSVVQVSGLNITSFSNNSITLETDGNFRLLNTRISNDRSFASNIRITADQLIELVALEHLLADPTAINTGGGDLTLSAGKKIDTLGNVSISTVGSNRTANIEISSVEDVVLPDIASSGGLRIESSQGSVVFGESVAVAGETRVTAGLDINLSGDTLFDPKGNVFFDAGRIIRVDKSSQQSEFGVPLPYIKLESDNSSSFFWNAGSGIIIDELGLGLGDFVANANNGIRIGRLHTGGKVLLRSIGEIDWRLGTLPEEGLHPLGSLTIYTDERIRLPAMLDIDGDLAVHAYSGAGNVLANTSFAAANGASVLLPGLSSGNIRQYDGIVEWWSSGPSSMFTNGGSFLINANEIDHFGGSAIDTSSSNGHGDITLVARGRVQAPPIRYSNAILAPQAPNSKITIQAERVLLDVDFDFNNAGIADVNIASSGDVILGVIRGDQHDLSRDGFLVPAEPAAGRIFDSIGGDGDRVNLSINAGGTVFQKYDLFTGGGDYSATADRFEFNDGVQLNTDFSNPTQDALTGGGNVTIRANAAQTELLLPGIVTQTNCLDKSNCGTLNVSAASVDNMGGLFVHGDAFFDVGESLRIDNFHFSTSRGAIILENGFFGGVSSNAGSANLSARGSLNLGEWNVSGNASIIAGAIGDGHSIIANGRFVAGGPVLLGGDYVEMKNAESRIGQLGLVVTHTEIDYGGDLNLTLAALYGSDSGKVSTFKIAGDLIASQDAQISGSTDRPPVISEAPAAAPIILDVGGNVQLLGERNRLSSIQIINAQNVEIFNNGTLTIDGANANNLNLDVNGDLTQTNALTISGATTLNARAGTTIDLSNPLNDFNAVNIQSAGPSTINIADSGAITLGSINLNGGGQGGVLSVAAAAISQSENGTISLQNAARLNLQGDYVTLGANGTATVDVSNAILNGVFTNDLNIQGAISGSNGAVLYFTGTGPTNFVEVAAGGSITGTFANDSKISLGAGENTVSLSGDVAVAIEGGAGADTFFIRLPNLNIAQIIGNGGLDRLVGPDANNIWSLLASGDGSINTGGSLSRFRGIEILQGGSAADDFLIETGTLAIQLNGGGGSDSLSGNSNTPTSVNEWVIDGDYSGSLNGLISFSAVENLVGNDAADRVTFAAGARIGNVSTGRGDDVVTLATNVEASLLDAGEGQDTLNLNGMDSIYTYLNELLGGEGNFTTANFELELNEGGSKTIVGVDGYDAEWVIDGAGTITVNALRNGVSQTNRFSGVTRLEGAAGNDSFILVAGGQLADQIIGGQGGVDSLRADNGQNNSWVINGVNSGRLNADAGSTALVFQSIANLIGGEGTDIFEIAAGGTITGSISGGLGRDTLEISDASATNNWQLGQQNSVGLVAQYQDIEILVGNANADIFTVNASTDVTALVGNGGANFLSWQAGSLVLNLADNTANETLSFADIGSFTADAAGNNTLIGANTDNLWVITNETLRSGTLNGLVFTGFGQLRGGEGADTLRGLDADLYWRIDEAGGGNVSTLQFGGENDGFRFSQIESLIGGDGDDVIQVLARPYIQFDGGRGENALVVFDPVRWVVTERAAGSVTVGSGEDISLSFFRNFTILSTGISSGTLELATTDIDGMRVSLRGQFNWGTIVNATGNGGDWRFDSFGDGTLRLGENELAFTGIASIVGSENPEAVDRMFGPNVPRAERPLTYQFGSGAYSGVLLDVLPVADDRPQSYIPEMLSFTGVKEIHGGNSGNVFVLGSAAATANYQGSIFGGDGEDLFLADTSLNSPATARLQGGGGTNTLIANRDNALNNSWTIDSANSGTLNTGVQFSNIQNLQGNAGNDTFTFTADSSIGNINAGAGNDTFILANNVTAGILDGGEGADTLDRGALNSIITYLREVIGGDAVYTTANIETEISSGGSTTVVGVDGYVAQWTITGNGTLNVTATSNNGVAVTNQFSGVTRAQGGTGTDAFILLTGGALVDGIVGSGDDSLQASDTTNAWTINALNGGSLAVQENNTTLLFQGIANLIGGSGSDLFEIVSGGSITGSVDGGAGADRLVISDETATNRWQLGVQNSVERVARFTRIETIVGNGGNDVFAFNGLSDVTATDGRGGNNTLLWRAGDVAVNLGTGLLNQQIQFSGISAFDADATGGNTLIGADEDNTWILTGADAGSLNALAFTGFNQLQGGSGQDVLQATDDNNRWLNVDTTSNALNDVLIFRSMERLIGGAGADEFATALVGVTAIDGGLGDNQLVASGAANNEWLIDGNNSGSFNSALAFQRIQNLIGSGSNDTFTFTANSTIGNINAGAGNDTFILANNITAGVLDGGEGADTLDRGTLNTIMTYLRDIIGGDAVYTAANIETETSSGGSTTVVGMDGYSAEWLITGNGILRVTATGSDGVAVTNEFTGVTRAEGGAGFDAFVLQTGGSLTDGVFGGGNDYLQGSETTNAWTINGVNSGEFAAQESGTQLRFQGIANLVGGNLSDIFDIASGGSISGAIYGSGGADSLIISDAALTNNWQLGQSNSVGAVAFFTEIETLIGNANSDTFNFTAATDVTAIQGGAGNNSLLWSAGDLVVELAAGQLNNTVAFSGINSATADVANRNRLIGANTDNVWTLTGANAGSVNTFTFAGFTQLQGGSGQDVLQAMDSDNRWTNVDATTNALNTTLVFSGMERLLGGAGADEFSAALVGVTAMDGGLGVNQLVASGAANNAWLIDGSNSGSFNATVAFQRIQNLLGGAGNDTFTFTANSSIGNINAGAGNDTFVLANNITAGLLDGSEGTDTLDRGALNSIITYLREVIGGDAVYTIANIETETSSGGSTTLVGVDGYNAQWTITGNGALSVTATGSNGIAVTNQFSGVTRAQGGTGTDAFILLAGGAVADGIVGSGDDSLQASDTTNTWTINALNGGGLAVQENNTTLLFQGIANLIGGSGSDIFEIVTGGSITGSIDGGAGADRLVISDETATNRWQLGVQNSVERVARFTRIETIVGNGGNDVFAFNGLTDVTAIDGRGGNNTLLWRAGDVAVNLGTGLLNQQIQFSGISGFDADAAGSNTLTGEDEDNTWALNGGASGNVTNAKGAVSFTGFQTLTGGAGADRFTLSTGAAGFSSLDGGAGADTLTAADQLNQWLLNATGGELNNLRFTNMETLVGGALQDNFVLAAAASQAQTIDGGAGANRLTGFDQANTWNISRNNGGSVTGLASFSNIQTLVGGAQVDTFNLAAGVNISEIYAGAGNDIFVLGTGVVADNLFGEAGDDSFDVDVGLVLSGVLDGGSGGETAGDLINLSKYTVLDPTADLEVLLGFAFRNFERVERPNNRGVYFGGNGTNFWYITGANTGRLEVRDGEGAGVYEFAEVHSLLGGTGVDYFIFANDSAAVSTLIDGGQGTGANTLDLSAQGLINQWLLDGANSGRVSNSSNTAGNIFTNIAYLIGGSNADRFELLAGGSITGAVDGGLGANELAVMVEQTSNWRLGEAAGHRVTGIASFTNIESLAGSAGTDVFDIFSPLADVARVNGGAGSDAINFRYDAPVTVDLTRGLAGGLRVEGIERFSALNAQSTFNGIESTATWTLTGANAGTLRYLLNTGGEAINVAFDGFGNLVGGAGDDQFVFGLGSSLTGTLNGGAGRNQVDLQALANDVHLALASNLTLPAGVAGFALADMDQLIGNGRTWLYGASDRSYTWTIDGARSGRVTSTLVDDTSRLLAFENLSAIRGGAHDDIFRVQVAAPLLSLDGGEAVTADFVDYSLVNGNLRINLAEALTGQNGVITGVEGIRGNNAGPSSLHNAELIGPDGGAVWRIGNFAGALADGINDGEVTFGNQTISFLDFNQLTGGAGNDVFNQISGIVLGTLNGGAGNDTFNVDVVGANTGTRIIGGAGNDSLFLRGGNAAGLLTYTAALNGGEFDYSHSGASYKVSHEEVEAVRDQTSARSLEVRGSSAVETFTLGNGRFQVNGGSQIEHSNKRDIAVRTGINDVIEIGENLVVEGSLTLANGTVIANDPANSSITAPRLVLDSVRDVGLASARLRTNVDELAVRNSVGDLYLQEQNGLTLTEFNANRLFDLVLLNGNLSNSAPLFAADVFRVDARNGDVLLTGANQLRDDVSVNGNRVELHNASTLTLVGINAQELILRAQRGIEGDGPVVVSGLTSIDAQGDVIFDFASNDFNRVRVTNAANLTLVDQNAIELLDINASGAVVIRSTNNVALNDRVNGANGVAVSSNSGSITQNGTIGTNSGAVVVSAGNGEVNLGDTARIVSNGGSVSINAGAGNVNMGSGTRIAANGGNVTIDAAESVVVAEVVSTGAVVINAGSGGVSDGNGGGVNIIAGSLQSSANTGFGNQGAIETQVGNINISTNSGNVAVSNTGAVTVDAVRTGQGDISLNNQGNVELGAGSVSAQNGANGGSVDINVSLGSVTQTGSTDIPAVKGTGTVVISAPDGAIGAGGGIRVDAPIVEIIAAIKAGEIFVNPGADKIEYFSGSFKFEDQLLAIAPLEDINPAIFANVRSYFFNDISLLLPRDQRYEDDEEEEKEEKE